MSTPEQTFWPRRLRFQESAARLVVEYDDGVDVAIPYKQLREESPSAEVRGHGAGPRPPAPVVADDITVTDATPVGRYAVRIRFSDGHDTGLYTWAYLRGLGETIG
ncbi:MAG: DUF971 domain-containing protein [Alphaproteobacteria bacterium]|jgi:DUF971 family protein|nr:DUF971 domain-containing protein [Alphaproteobacteria bacterium]